MNKKILFISDMGILGSGYKNLSIPLCEGLVHAGHEVKVIGLEYRGQQHDYPFSVIPCDNFKTMFAMINNLWYMWKPDIMIVALDIPLQKHTLDLRDEIIKNNPKFDTKYWGIFPVEADPMSNSTAYTLQRMDRRFIISEFGVKEAEKQMVDALYLPVPIDTKAWKIPTKDERGQLRTAFGFSKDTFVILTVADNQERKFLSRTAQIISEFRKKVQKNSVWVLVTRINFKAGWNLTDLVTDMGLMDAYIPMERGIPFRDLWGMYAMSDVFLLTSKAEGLGMPVLEAMSVGLPVVATNCTGMKESMQKGAGFAISPEDMKYNWIDPFENQKRYFADVDSGVQQLRNVYENQGVQERVRTARGYVETLTQERAVQVLLSQIGD